MVWISNYYLYNSSNEEERETRDSEWREAWVRHQSASYFYFYIVSAVWELYIRKVREFILVYTWISTDIRSSFPVREVIRLSPPYIAQLYEIVVLVKHRAGSLHVADLACPGINVVVEEFDPQLCMRR